jgi:hypothetical protein
MKTYLFLQSAAISGAISFFGVKAYRNHQQKRFNRKMETANSWLDIHPPIL